MKKAIYIGIALSAILFVAGFIIFIRMLPPAPIKSGFTVIVATVDIHGVTSTVEFQEAQYGIQQNMGPSCNAQGGIMSGKIRNATITKGVYSASEDLYCIIKATSTKAQ